MIGGKFIMNFMIVIEFDMKLSTNIVIIYIT